MKCYNCGYEVESTFFCDECKKYVCFYCFYHYGQICHDCLLRLEEKEGKNDKE